MIQNLFPTSTPADTTKIADITKDVSELKSLSFNDLVDRLAHDMVNFAINLTIAIVVFYLGRFVINKIYRLVGTIFIRRNVDRSLSTFVLSLIRIVLYFILIVTVIGILGIETSSFLALFASAGVAIGMALSGTLQNFAGGVLILFLKPYRIGDYIEVQGYAGTVREIQIFATIITTFDNKSISIPNGPLSTGSVNNWSKEKYRRVTWSIDITYGDDVNAARDAILTMFEADERIMPGTKSETITDVTVSEDNSICHTQTGDCVNLPDDDDDTTPVDNAADSSQATAHSAPKRSLWDKIMHRHRRMKEEYELREKKRDADLRALRPSIDYTPKVLVNELAASAVNLQVRAWAKTSDYWNVFFYYNERFYNELPAHGIHFPYPKLDVTLTPQQP